MKIISIYALIITAVFINGFCQAQSKKLFNGKNLRGWHVDVPEIDKDASIPSPFLIRKGLLVSMGTPRGHLITNKIYRNYRLEVQYRFAGKPGNCGVLVHASEPRALYDMFPKSLEIQMEHTNAGDFWCIQEDISVPNMETRRGPKENWGSSANKLRRISNLTDGSEKPLGEWNNMIIECYENNIKVWLNTELVNEGFDCSSNHGNIAIQAEGSEVEFRKVVIKRINNLTQ